MKNNDGFWNLCYDCGFVANNLMCLKKYGNKSRKPSFGISTVRKGECDICGETKTVAPIRDFFYPTDNACKAVQRYLRRRDP